MPDFLDTHWKLISLTGVGLAMGNSFHELCLPGEGEGLDGGSGFGTPFTIPTGLGLTGINLRDPGCAGGDGGMLPSSWAYGPQVTPVTLSSAPVSCKAKGRQEPGV